MPHAIRLTLAVLSGMATWTALWLGGNAALQAAFPDEVVPGNPLSATGILLGLIAWSGILSLLAGFVTARLAAGQATTAVWVLAGIQLALGLFFEISNWALLPVWYHLVFLALIVPLTLLGGRLGRHR